MTMRYFYFSRSLLKTVRPKTRRSTHQWHLIRTISVSHRDKAFIRRTKTNPHKLESSEMIWFGCRKGFSFGVKSSDFRNKTDFYKKKATEKSALLKLLKLKKKNHQAVSGQQGFEPNCFQFRNFHTVLCTIAQFLFNDFEQITNQKIHQYITIPLLHNIRNNNK